MNKQKQEIKEEYYKKHPNAFRFNIYWNMLLALLTSIICGYFLWNFLIKPLWRLF